MSASRVNPEPYDPVSADQQDQALGLADRFDQLILRLELWRERPIALAGLVLSGVVIATAGWWFGRAPAAQPVEDLIPLATAPERPPANQPGLDGEQAAGDGGASSSPGSASTNPEHGQSSDPERSGPQVGSNYNPDSNSNPNSNPDPEHGDVAGAVPELVVHVVGAVRRPGLVRLREGSRIDDAVAAAGGATDGSDIEKLNLAALIADGMQIRVPLVDDEIDGPLIIGSAPPAGTDEPPGVGPVNINTGTDSQLQALPGIGPATAAAIVAWRSDNGQFLSVEELTLVPGIGPAKLAAIRDLVVV